MQRLKKYLAEGLLIVFSVLFALFINKLADDYQVNKKKKTAIESIQLELQQNADIIEEWQELHTAVRKQISDMIEGRNDSLKNELVKYNFLNFGVLTNNQSLIDAVLTNTAWESTKVTGIIAELDFETTQKLTQVYDIQKVLSEKTIIEILDFYFDQSSHDMENIDKTLLQFQLRFWELTGQESLLSNLYQEVIEHLKQ